MAYLVDNKPKVYAVLVGCNYPNTPFELRGCINDVNEMKAKLEERVGFKDVKLLIDSIDRQSPEDNMPTGKNIKDALYKMADKVTKGDVLFFHFSGHGALLSSLDRKQPFRQYEAIVPCDLNLITDVDFRDLVSQVTKKGASFTFLLDSCLSGGLIDKEKEQTGERSWNKRSISAISILDCLSSIGDGVSGIGSILSEIFGKEVSLKFQNDDDKQSEKARSPPLGEDEGILLSGCQKYETSTEANWVTGEDQKGPHGVFTIAVLEVLKNNSTGPVTNRVLVLEAKKVLKRLGFEQNPCLYCSDNNAHKPFLLE